MKRILMAFCIGSIGTITCTYGQSEIVSGQYFQNLPAVSPSFTGVNEFLDIRTGYRNQWTGFEGAPTTLFLSAYAPLNLKLSNINTQNWQGGNTSNTQLKMGTGAYLLTDKQGPYSQMKFATNFAIHVPIRQNTFLSLGASAGINNNKIDISEITIQDEINDQTYLSFITNGGSSTFFNLSPSIGIHSDRYYFSYSAMQLTSFLISGNKELNVGGARIAHHLLGGYLFTVNNRWVIIPNTFIRFQEGLPIFFETGLRARYNKNLQFGMSYRNDRSLINMIGLSINELINFGYSFEYKITNLNDFNNGSHEIVLGFRLFGHSHMDQTNRIF